MIQLPESIADKLVQRSGEEGIFACQLGAPRTDKRIEWFPRHGKESDEAYHRRLFATAQARKEGLKYRKGGSCDLGLFVAAADIAKMPLGSSHWSATGFPKDWHQEEILQFLQEQGWTDLVILNDSSSVLPSKCVGGSKPKPRKGVCQCKLPGNIACLMTYAFIEGSLEVKLPTIWRDEKQSREEAERRERLEERRVEEKE